MKKIEESNALLNVLCLEDAFKDAELLNEMLVDAGYLVNMDFAEREEAFISFLKSRKYHIILADYTLPGFNAPAALKLALELQPEVPFICVSGTIGEDTAVELLKRGATDYVLKDRLGRLAFAVRRALEGKELQKELAYQNKEKEKRANELIIANKELAFQNEEKEKRATELILANKELAFQNEEKEKREAELIRSKQLLDEAGRLARIGGWEIDLKNNKLSWSDVVYQIHEIEPDYQPTVESGINFYDPEAIPVISEAVRRAIEEGKSFDNDLQLITAKQNRIWVRAIGQAYRVNGEIVRIGGVFQDINNRILTEHKLILANKELVFQNEEKEKRAAELILANKELVFQNEEKEKRASELVIANKELVFQNKEKEKRAIELIIAKEKAEEFESKFKQIAENIDEVFWLRTDSEMIYVSPSFEKIWGVPCQAIYENPQKFIENIHPEDKTVVQEIFQSNEFKEHGLFEYEYRILRADNQVRWINTKTFPILDDSEQIIKRVGIASDITEKHQTVQELIQSKEHAEESDKLKSAFLANMSHEIRTPMNGILGFSELLKEPGLTGERQQEYIRIIEKSGARMLNIINDIVDISRIEAGLMNVDIKDTNINDKIEFIYIFFKPQVEDKGMKLFFKNTLTAKEATIRTDSEKVYSILTNLVKNAIKYSKEGVIEFGYLKRDETLEFYVTDTGIGIPKDRQSAIFERFIQADITDRMALQGAGLGLSISKAYVEMLGGKIWVESEEGIGSTFYFTLPYNAEPEEKKVVGKVVPAQNEENQIKDLKILIAEDDETSEMLISITVKEFSKEVLKARSGKEAIEICRTNPDLDLILMDIQMPDLNGLEATRQIRQFNKDVVIIAQTAFGLSGDGEKAIEAGCNDFIAKPINKDELLSLIQKYFKK